MTGVLVDTCVWSLAFRAAANNENWIVEALARIIDNNRARIIGPIRQEILSGYSNKNRYDRLRKKLSYFPNVPILDLDYEAAAEYSNFCRTKLLLH